MLLNLFVGADETPWQAKVLLRRIVLWSAVCWACAWPSLRVAMQAKGFDLMAMCIGVPIVAMLLILVTGAAWCSRLQERPATRNAILATYYGLAVLSVCLPPKVALFLYLFPGIAGLYTGAAIAANEHRMFLITLIAVVVEGVVCNVALAFIMAVIVLPVVRAWSGNRPEPRGFEVIMPGPQTSKPPHE